MKVLVYVEGPSDEIALRTLLDAVVTEGQSRGIGIRFLTKRSKTRLLAELPEEAAEYLSEHPNDWVIALPDLYPMAPYDQTRNAHRSPSDLVRVLREHFNQCASAIWLPDAARARFTVHCLKHDLETLLLAAEGALRQRLGTTDRLADQWCQPVEDQNDVRPPKRVVEDLFRRYRKRRYEEVTDARWILARADLSDLVWRCPQCFAPFVRALRAIVDGRTPP